MYDENKHISLMENFNRQKFQWIKTKDRSRLAKVVTCIDIVPSGRSFVAKFDDGSSTDVSRISSDLMMITADMPALSKAEVESINGPVITSTPKAGEGPIKLPPELQKEAEAMRAEAALANKQVVSTQIVSENPTFAGTTVSHIAKVTPSTIFSAFNSEETQISLGVNIKLPEKKLLKMMYMNAESKDKFVEDLSEFILSQINKQVVSSSVLSMLMSSKGK